MFIRRSSLSLVALVAGVGLFAGCEDSEKATETAAAPTETPAPKPPADLLPADMVAAVSANRTSNAIGMHFALGAKPEVNKALPVEIAIVPRQEFEAVSVHFLSQEGLAVTVGGSYGPTARPAVGRPLRHQLVLLPRRDGVFVITGSVETTEPAGNFTRLFSIPVVVAPPGSAEDVQETPATTAQPQSPDSPAAN
jgi:hypothetical protein